MNPDKYKREETERCQFPDPTPDSHVLLSNKIPGNHIVNSHAEPFQLWSTSEIVGYLSVSWEMMCVPFYVVAFGQALHAFRGVTKSHARATRWRRRECLVAFLRVLSQFASFAINGVLTRGLDTWLKEQRCFLLAWTGGAGGVRWEYINDKDNLVPMVLSYSSLRSEREKVTDNPGNAVIRIKRGSDGSMRPFTRSVFLRLRKTCQVSRLHHEPFYRGFPCQFASVNVARMAFHLYLTPFLVFYATPILPSLGQCYHVRPTRRPVYMG